MKLLLTLALPMTFLSACDDWQNSEAICDGTIGLRKAHARALIIDGGPLSLDTGERLLTGFEAGCDE